MGGVREDEPKKMPGHDTEVRVWPVLAMCQADTPFMAAAMGANGHKGHAACWRCGCEAYIRTGKADKNKSVYVAPFCSVPRSCGPAARWCGLECVHSVDRR